VATTPSAAIFQGVDDHIIGTALVEGQTGSRLRTSDLRLRTTCRTIPEVKTSGFGRRTSDVGPHAAGPELFGYCCRDSISEFNIRPSFPDLSMRSPASDSEKNFRFFAIKICVSSSSREPRAWQKNNLRSRSEERPLPSAILLGILKLQLASSGRLDRMPLPWERPWFVCRLPKPKSSLAARLSNRDKKHSYLTSHRDDSGRNCEAVQGQPSRTSVSNVWAHPPSPEVRGPKS